MTLVVIRIGTGSPFFVMNLAHPYICEIHLSQEDHHGYALLVSRESFHLQM